MKRTTLLPILFMFLLVAVTIGFSSPNGERYELDTTQATENQDGKAKSLAAFDKMMTVLTHKRCVNCHPAGDRPHQGEDSHVHNFNVQRGPANHGVASLSCNTCHQEENNNFSGVPGAPEWSLAPREMAWEGLSRVEIAKSMLDPNINGGRDLHATVEHLTEHALVLWAWNPGIDAAGNAREKPPVPKDEYIAAVKEWAENGAHIPEQ